MNPNAPSVGDAPEYIDYDTSNLGRDESPNCYSYAIGLYDCSYNPGDFSSPFLSYSLDAVAKAVQTDFDNLNRGCRIIDSYNSPINENEYRIALRVKNSFLHKLINWYYHFMVQTASGKWAEKFGPSGPTEYHHVGNPDIISWGCGSGEGTYNSDIIYFAITR